MKLEIPMDEIGSYPKEIKKVLKEFEDVMPSKLPKKLPPQRDVDHRIKLELRTKPLARPPYQLPLTELRDLRKQLNELLEGGLIWSSKSP